MAISAKANLKGQAFLKCLICHISIKVFLNRNSNAFLTYRGPLHYFFQKEIKAKATRKLAITYEILNFLTGEEKQCLSIHLLPKTSEYSQCSNQQT